MAIIKVLEHQRIGLLKVKLETSKTKYELSGIQNFKDKIIRHIIAPNYALPNQATPPASITLKNHKGQIVVEELAINELNYVASYTPLQLEIGKVAWDKSEINLHTAPAGGEVGKNLYLYIIYDFEKPKNQETK